MEGPADWQRISHWQLQRSGDNRTISSKCCWEEKKKTCQTKTLYYSPSGFVCASSIDLPHLLQKYILRVGVEAGKILEPHAFWSYDCSLPLSRAFWLYPRIVNTTWQGRVLWLTKYFMFLKPAPPQGALFNLLSPSAYMVLGPEMGTNISFSQPSLAPDLFLYQ